MIMPDYTFSSRPYRCPGCRCRTPGGAVRRRPGHETRFWTVFDKDGRIVISAPECLFLTLWAGATRYRMSDADRALLRELNVG